MELGRTSTTRQNDRQPNYKKTGHKAKTKPQTQTKKTAESNHPKQKRAHASVLTTHGRHPLWEHREAEIRRPPIAGYWPFLWFEQRFQRNQSRDRETVRGREIDCTEFSPTTTLLLSPHLARVVGWWVHIEVDFIPIRWKPWCVLKVGCGLQKWKVNHHRDTPLSMMIGNQGIHVWLVRFEFYKSVGMSSWTWRLEGWSMDYDFSLVIDFNDSGLVFKFLDYFSLLVIVLDLIMDCVLCLLVFYVCWWCYRARLLRIWDYVMFGNNWKLNWKSGK